MLRLGQQGEREVSTQGNEQPLSQVAPLLVAVLVCDAAAIDPSTGKKSLIGIFDRVNVGAFPTERPLSLYFKVTDAEGRYKIEVRYIHADTDKTLASTEEEFQFANRLQSRDFLVQFPPLPMPEAGRYAFQLWANSMFLGSAFIDAAPWSPSH